MGAFRQYKSPEAVKFYHEKIISARINLVSAIEWTNDWFINKHK